MGASAAASKFLVTLSAAKNPGSFSAQTDATPTTDRSQRTPDAQANVQLDAKTCASANPGFFASIQNDMERFAQISQKQEHGYAKISCKGEDEGEGFSASALFQRDTRATRRSQPEMRKSRPVISA